MTRDRSFYRQFFTLCLTLMAERLVVCSVNLLDNIMLGSYAETAMAAAAAVNQLQFLFQQLIYATGAGMVILGGQYWAQGQRDQVRRIVPIGLRWGAGFALVFFLLAALLPRQLVSLFTKDQTMIQLGAEYLQIIKYTCPLFAVTQLLLASLRTVKVVQISLRVSLLSLLVNCGLNYILISGRFGAPALGVTGAAIGTLTARGLECTVVLFYVLRRDRILRLRPADLRQTPGPLARDFARLTAPICLIEFLWGCNMAIQTAVMGHLSAAAIAAQSISVTSFTLLKVASLGSASATTVLIGQAVGRGDEATIRADTRTLQVLFCGLGLVLAAIMLLLRRPLLQLYALQPETAALARQFILIQAAVVFLNAYHLPTNTGIIRGGGDTNFSVKLDLCVIWCFAVPLSLLAAFVWHWPPVAVLLCLNADQAVKCIPIAIRANRYHWVKHLTQPTSNLETTAPGGHPAG